MTSDISAITGNASEATKAHVLTILPSILRQDGAGFGDHVGQRLIIKEVDIEEIGHTPARQRARVVVETVVDDDMLNLIGVVHGGCTAYLVGCCSLLPTAALNFVQDSKRIIGTSDTANILYHAPALKGTQLRIISVSLALGFRVSTSTCEIWDVAQNRLIASGIHVKSMITARNIPRDVAKL